jgi:hypothetical protein
MPGRYKKTLNKNRSRFYIFLSIVFVAFMIKWGIPLFTNLVAGNGAQRISSQGDIIPPQSPVISALPDATNSARVVVEGFTEAGANIELVLNNKTDKLAKADETGSFVLESTLVSGENTIQLKAKDEAGNESSSSLIKVIYDNKPIELVVSSPKDGSEYFGKTNQVIDIKEEVDKEDCQVLVNNSFVQVNKDGSFVHRFMLSGGDNNIKIVASDAAGNSTEKDLRLVYTP